MKYVILTTSNKDSKPPYAYGPFEKAEADEISAKFQALATKNNTGGVFTVIGYGDPDGTRQCLGLAELIDAMGDLANAPAEAA